jgi:hypothetical protein
VDSSGIRVADADREQLVEELREHMLAGRLSSDEFEERLASAYRAVTQAELDALRADLPMGLVRVQSALALRRGKLRRRLIQEGGGALGVSGMCVAIWAVSGAHHGGSFWPIWVILATMIPVVRNAWRLFGPAPDVESVERHLDARSGRGSRRERHRRRGRRYGPPGPPRPPGLPR